MSDPVKPEETQPVVVESSAPKPDEVAPVAETASEPAVTTTATGDEVTPVVEKPAGESVEEKKEEEEKPQEITKGTLSKLHGGLLSFFKRERFFYFSEDALSEERLKTYLHRDNSSVANAAYATQTGKGLLLYSKQEGHVPHGIIKLADVTEVVSIGPTKFDLKLPSGDLHFESPTNRDSWVFTLKQKVAEARAAEEEVINSDGYKAALERLTKPTAVAAGKAPAEAKEKEKEKEPEEAEKVKKAEGSTADNEAGPSGLVKRSASKGKKKVSALRELLGKKEKKEEPVEKKEDVPEDSKAGEPTTATTTTANGLFMKFNFEDEETNKTAAPPVTDAPEEAKEVKPSEEAGPKKRHSIFGSLFPQKDKETEQKKEKEPETVKTEPETGAKPIDTPVASASTEKAERTSTSSPPKAKFSSFFEKRKAEKEPEVKPEDVKPAETTSDPVPVPAATTDAATPAEGPSTTDSPSPATSPKERRLSSFFPFKKEKKADDVKSDTEEAEPSSPKPTTTPAGFVASLYRRASKAGRSSPKETEAKEVVAPTTVPEETPAATTAETQTPNGTDGPAEPAPAEPTAIGDVVSEAVNVGGAPPVQAAA